MNSGVSFYINKSFANVELVPNSEGLHLTYHPLNNGAPETDHPGFLDLQLPMQALGGLWATARAFLYAVESLDENVILKADPDNNIPNDVLIKLYRDKPKGDQGKISGEENCWLRLVNGRSEDERRRIKLGPRDLLSLELACQTASMFSVQAG